MKIKKYNIKLILHFMNTIPYMYDESWRDYLIEYYSFAEYKLIKDYILI